MQNRIVSFFKLSEINERTQKIAIRFLTLGIMISLFHAFSSTFLVLHLIDLVGFSLTGILFFTYFLLSAITDYPTGVLADWIGHKWVLSIAHMMFFVVYGSLIFVNEYTSLLIIISLYAVANGQLSGALNSWFDNSYNHLIGEDDPNKEIYREFQGQFQMVSQLTAGLTFVLGGILATYVIGGRRLVFGIQSLSMLLIAIVAFNYLEKFDDVKDDQSYMTQLLNGIKVVWHNPTLRLYATGAIIQLAVITAWGALIVFPIYYGYTGSDFGASVLRFLIFLFIGILLGIAGKIAKQLDNMMWIPRLKVLDYLVFYGLSAIILLLFPLMNQFNLVPVILILIGFVLSGFFFSIYNILEQKLYLDIVPNQNRNSYYSLVPTLGLLLSSVIVYIAGKLITNYSMASAVMMMTGISVSSVIFTTISIYLYVPDEDKTIDLGQYQSKYHSFVTSISNTHEVMIPDTWIFSEQKAHIMKSLFKISLDDGKLTEDEKSLLVDIMSNLQRYGQLLEEAYEDNKLTADEKEQLLQYRQQLVDEAHQTALQDDEIVEDEQLILDRLQELLDQLELD